MLALMNRSIDLMQKLTDESGNIFHTNWRGSLYVTHNETSTNGHEKIAILIDSDNCTSKKNPAESATMINAIDILHSGMVEGFWLVSSDSTAD